MATAPGEAQRGSKPPAMRPCWRRGHSLVPGDLGERGVGPRGYRWACSWWAAQTGLPAAADRLLSEQVLGLLPAPDSPKEKETMPAERKYGMDQDFYTWSPIVSRPI